MVFKQLKKIFFSFAILYIIQLLISTAFIYCFTINQVKFSFQNIIEHIKEDIRFNDSTWDTSAYNTDPEIPGRYRLYIFSTDGFVVERWRPVSGFLDTSDFKRLLAYQQPQTIRTITNQDWRMYSQPILSEDKKTIGVISVSYFNPDESLLEKIDEKLQNSMSIILKKITIKNGIIKTDNDILKTIPLDTPFIMVDQYNTIVMKSDNSSSMDRIPNFIDPSYVREIMNHNSTFEIKNNDQTDSFLLATQILYDAKHQARGVVVVGRIISEIYDLVKYYVFFNIFFGALSLIIFMFLVVRINRRNTDLVEKKTLRESEIKEISFSKKDCDLIINDYSIHFAYASNQYYMCTTLFSNPNKKWETDELLEKFGEEINRDGWRKIYDAMSVINRKAAKIIETKLIITNNKTFQVNPVLVKKII